MHIPHILSCGICSPRELSAPFRMNRNVRSPDCATISWKKSELLQVWLNQAHIKRIYTLICYTVLIANISISVQFIANMTWHNTTSEQQRLRTKTKNKKIFWSWEFTYMCRFHSSGACPTNDTRTKPETRPKSDALRLNTYPTDHKEISHTPRQCNGRDVCKTAPRSAEHTQNQSTPNPDQNPNPI